MPKHNCTVENASAAVVSLSDALERAGRANLRARLTIIEMILINDRMQRHLEPEEEKVVALVKEALVLLDRVGKGVASVVGVFSKA